MNEHMITVFLGLGFAFLLLWLLRPRQHPTETSGSTIDRAIECSLPKHYKFFPQIRQALSAKDDQYLHDMAPPMWRNK